MTPRGNGFTRAFRKAIPLEAPKFSWGTMLGSRNVWALTLSYFCYGYTPAIFFTWFFIYLTRVRRPEPSNRQLLRHAAVHRHVAWDRQGADGLPTSFAGDSAVGGDAAAWPPSA